MRRLRAAGCVFAEEEAALLTAAASSAAELEAMIDRRLVGVPLEHVVGWAQLCGVRVAVEPGVFVPRRRTELLVREAAAAVHPGAVVVDLCCGSGAVGAVLRSLQPAIDLYAADIDPIAVRCARHNLTSGGGHVAASVVEGDLYGALPDELLGRVDVLVVNAPYVPTAAIAWLPAEARLHESLVALDGGIDGLDVQRRVIADAGAWLRSTGRMLIETSADQADATAELLTGRGFAATVVTDDELDATVAIGTLSAR